ARAVGVDPAACYRHFRGKDEVVQALARRGFTRLVQRMERAMAREPDAERALRALGRTYVRFARERPVDFRVMFGPNGIGARDLRVRGDYERGGIEILVDAIRAWRGGPKPDDDARAMALWAAVHGVASLTVDGTWGLDDAAVDDVLTSLLDRLLVP